MSRTATIPDAALLKRAIIEFIADPGAGDFEMLALEVFRHQWERNPAYRALAERGVASPGEVSDWRAIPAASTAAFKHRNFTTGTPTLTFRTSGTTRGLERRGTHHLVDADLYRAALRHSFRRFVLPDLEAEDRMRLIVLAPTPSWAPDSSLGFMMGDLLESCGARGSASFLGPDGLDGEGLFRALADATRDDVPVALLGTALAFVHLLERMEMEKRAYRLPAGSRIMDTGGFKGRIREVAREDLLAGYRERLGIPAGRVVNEYGMTEMSSQFYDASLLGGDPDVKLGPHWVRTRIIDPASGAEVAPGEPGLLLHVDLANLDSVAAIETEDLGYLKGDGFVLAGRAVGSEERGCSLAADELLGSDG